MLEFLAVVIPVGLLFLVGSLVLRPLMKGVLAKEARREAARPIPPHWLPVLDASVPLTRRLPEPARITLLGAARELIETLHWEGCGGFSLTPNTQLVIAAQACLLTLARPGEPFPGLREVLVYPSAFVPRRVCDPRTWLASSEPQRPVPELGESWGNGVIVLGWEASQAGAANPGDGHNVVLHEFAHELAYEHDLVPPSLVAEVLPAYGGKGPRTDWNPVVAEPAAWRRVLLESFQRLCGRVDRGEPSALDRYGATNPAEFFAVATETFFERARQLAAEEPELHGQLRAFYGQDPASVPG